MSLCRVLGSRALILLDMYGFSDKIGLIAFLWRLENENGNEKVMERPFKVKNWPKKSHVIL